MGWQKVNPDQRLQPVTNWKECSFSNSFNNSLSTIFGGRKHVVSINFNTAYV